MATTHSRRLPRSQVLLGAIVVLIGLLLLLNTTETVPTAEIFLYVPTLFVLVGVWALVHSRLRNLVGPIVLILVAGAAQLVLLDVVTIDQVIVYWPVLVIAFGVSILASQYRSKVQHTEDSFTTAFSLFGGVDKRNASRTFTGGELTSIFGASELDLRDAEIDQPPARIHAIALFGGIEIQVPEEWNVQLDAFPVFGDVSDTRPRHVDEHEDTDLVVTGFAAFGEISIRD